MTNWNAKYRYILSIAVAAAAFLIFIFIGHHSIEPWHSDDINFEYYKDSSGKMELEEALEKLKQGEWLYHKNETFSFGTSASTYWIRIPLGQITPQVYKQYISIYNPTVTKAVLYLPVLEKGKTVYRTFPSGWYFGETKQGEGFSYPVFQWQENTDFSKDVYIQLYSDFTQNYRITFLSDNEFKKTLKRNILFHGILFGVLSAVALQNLITFFFLKNRSNLFYFLYIFFMLIYQGCLLGIYNIFFPAYSKWIMGNTITFSLVVMASALIFYRDFFKTKQYFPIYDRIIRWLMLFIFVGFVLLLTNQFVIANVYAHSISIIGSLLVMFVTLQAYRKGFEQAGLFMLGWCFMIVGLVISFFRNSGWLPNNVVTLNITMIAVVVQSVLLSVALVQMIQILTEEKEKALKKYRVAEESAQSHEIAFLHAQIKPHFLYNALNVIIGLCGIDSERASELLQDLSDFLRHSFDFHEEQKLVSLQEELEYVQAYVRIEQTRFRNKLDVIFELDEVLGLEIPPLVLQPLVENAIIHGIRKKNGAGTIRIRGTEEDGAYRIEVKDNGSGMSVEQIETVLSENWCQGRGVGITNINKRLKKIYGQGLEIESVQGEGTAILFRIPKGDGKHVDSNPDR